METAAVLLGNEQILIAMNAFVVPKSLMTYFSPFLYSDGVNRTGFIPAQEVTRRGLVGLSSGGFPTWMFLWPGAVISQELSQTALRVHWQQGKRFPTLSVMGSIHSSKDSCPCLSQWHQGSEFMSHQYSWLTHQAQGSESMSHQHFWLTSLSKCLSATQVQRKNPSWARWSCCSNSTLIITSNY